eukprot:365011-Chlamydomonas_euryale.AAC.19
MPQKQVIKNACIVRRTAWPASGSVGGASGDTATGPGALCVSMKTLDGVTTTHSAHSPSAEADLSHGSASATGGMQLAMRPTPPATSATPVQLTWNLRQQHPSAAYHQPTANKPQHC